MKCFFNLISRPMVNIFKCFKKNLLVLKKLIYIITVTEYVIYKF